MKKTGFRYKHDQLHLDALRMDASTLFELGFRAASSLDINVGYTKPSLYAEPSSGDYQLLSSVTSFDYLQPALYSSSGFSNCHRYQALLKIQKYRRLYGFLQRRQVDLTALRAIFNRNRLEGMVDRAPLLTENLERISVKIDQIEKILAYLTGDTENSYGPLDSVAYLEFDLATLLSYEERCVLEGIAISCMSFADMALQTGKLLRQLIRHIVASITRVGKRDLRQSYRRIVRLLFKNMDDNSGADGLFSITRKQILHRILNYHFHEKQKRTHQIYSSFT